MISLDPQQQAARTWFESLRDRICAEFEAIEREAGSDAAFTYTPWDREAEGLANGEGGGGVRGVMTGGVFEKVGVNVSTVGGLVYEVLGRVPRAGEEIMLNGFRVIVEKVVRRRVTRVFMERLPGAGNGDLTEHAT